MASIAFSWATASKPPASVSATSSARLPSAENQTPSRFAGAAAGSRSTMRRSSPVGSRGSTARGGAAGWVASSPSADSSALRSAGALKRSGATAGLST